MASKPVAQSSGAFQGLGDSILAALVDAAVDGIVTLEKVFSLFEPLDQSRPGRGFGLAPVQCIVAVYGGRAWARSVGQGASSFFEVPAEVDGS